MNESLWGTLPEECLDRIVAFLPLPALSRFRVVSKKYNAWILSEKFIKLCAQLPLRGSQVWVTCWEKRGGLVSTNFRVCADSKLLASAHVGMLPDYGRWNQSMGSALGCLLLVECTKRLLDGSGPVQLVICDFSTVTCTRLPEPINHPDCWYGCSHVMFGQCGEDTGAFKIAIMDDLWHGYSHVMFGQCGEDTGAFKIAIMDDLWHQRYQVYNSITQSWKVFHPQRFTYGEMINRIFIFDKIFFLLRMHSIVTDRYGIVAFDTNTGKYESIMMITKADDMQVTKTYESIMTITKADEKQVTKKRKEIRTNFILGASYEELASLKLTAANNRLHLTGWIGGKVLHVFEVDLPNMQLTRIAELPMSSMQNITSADVHIGGHRECILLYSSKGGNMIYDFCRKKWRGLRDCPLFRGRHLSNFDFYVENGNEWDAGL